MRQEDLMIGDLLHAQPNNKIVRVVELKESEIVCTERCYDLRPIPITPGILEANGFRLEGDAYLSDAFALYLINKGCKFVLSTDRCTIMLYVNYVHELQHALRLCKIDKEIKL